MSYNVVMNATNSNISFLKLIVPAILIVGVVFSINSPVLLMLLCVAFVTTTFFLFYGKGFNSWQFFSYVIILLYAALNYGFSNFSFTLGGINLPVGTIGMLLVFFLAVLQNLKKLKPLLNEPIIWCFLFLIMQTVIHIIFDLKDHGYYSVRDTSYIIESLFIVIGYLWSVVDDDRLAFLKALFSIFLIVFLYSLTYPFEEFIQSVSFVSGVFQPVPIFGNYTHIAILLISGGFFYILLGDKVSRVSPKLIFYIGAIMLIYSIVFQERSMYLGLFFGLILMSLIGEKTKLFITILGLIFGVFSLFALISLSGIRLEGRVGEASLDFYISHFRSFLLDPTSESFETIVWRFELLKPLYLRYVSSGVGILWGEGYGSPLIDFMSATGTDTRQPHNIYVTILLRLGIVGLLVWIAINIQILVLMFKSLKLCIKGSFEYNYLLWYLIFLVQAFLMSIFQPWLEFSHGSVIFYVFLGYYIGFLQQLKR